ncbi:MAG: glycine zipper domain-containing protein [Patescibacteria group bacterium]|nr:glycine zipper domain-containing protein [Patescibacteria group bacterium]
MRMQPACAAIVLLLASTTVMAQQHTERGALLGGVAGALAGAGIGHHNDNAGAGALIGGAVGLITGATLGNAMDEQDARDRAIRHDLARRISRAVSNADVVAMTHGGVQPEIIVNHIYQNGVQRRPEVSDVIYLHQQGVSPSVISAMQQAPFAQPVTVVTPRYQAPVVVQEYHYVGPRVHYWAPPPHYRPHYYGPPRPHSGVHWNVVVRP